MFTILWDNDGVLVDTEGFYFQSCRCALATAGIGLTTDAFKEISLRQGESVFGLAAEQGFTADVIARLRAERDRMYAESLRANDCAIDGAEDVLRSLHGRFRMGIVSSVKREHFEIVHAGGRLTRYLDFVITHGDYERSKPYPDSYLTALKRYNLQPAECVVVEDSQRGLAAATAAGLRCLVVRSEWTQGINFGDAKVLGSIRDVPNEVLRLAGKSPSC